MDKSANRPTKKKSSQARTVEARENELIAAAIDLADAQIKSGRVSSQVLSHFLKLGSTKERLEKEKLKQENELLRAKTESLQSAKNVEALYKDALNAMRSYRGEKVEDDSEDSEDD